MKNCPFCAEEIQSEAIKCKHCREWLADDTIQEKKDVELKKNQSSENIISINNSKTSNGQTVETSPKKPSFIRKIFHFLSNILYFLVWLTLLSFIFFNITVPIKVTGKDALYMPIWVGILSAWTAKKKGKSGWLWFFIGLLIGFSIIFLLIYSHPYLISR